MPSIWQDMQVYGEQLKAHQPHQPAQVSVEREVLTLASAYSRDLSGNGQRSFKRAVKCGTDPLINLMRRQNVLGFGEEGQIPARPRLHCVPASL